MPPSRPPHQGRGVTGRLVAVVGASGVGKDSLIDALVRADPTLLRARRTITRPPGPGEAFDSVSAETFAAMRAAGAFCLAWEAHGLAYGIPAAVARHVARGGTAIANLSRGTLPEAGRLAPLLVLHLTARPQTLAARLGARGREGAAAIADRLGRATAGLPQDAGPVVTIANDGSFGATLAAARAALLGAAP